MPSILLGWHSETRALDIVQSRVLSLSETIRLMAEIDEVIETHGGWPGAFQTPSA
jgi:hypothetical protein